MLAFYIFKFLSSVFVFGINRSKLIFTSSLFLLQKNIEEKKVRELFALSSSFKLHDYLQHNMNEYEGVGVNIFKSCDSKAREILHQKSTQSLDSVKWMNNSYHCNSKPFQPYTPLTGFIAVKPYVRDEMENSAHIPLSEVWDEDFYF